MQFLISFTVIFVLMAMISVGMSVPTSVLAKNSELNNKVKRSSNDKIQSPQTAATSGNRENFNDFTTNNKNPNLQTPSAPTTNTATILTNVLSGGSNIEGQLPSQTSQQQQHHVSSAPVLQKRGVNSQLMYGGGDLYNNPIPSAALTSGGGVWSDEIDPPLMYSDLQDLQDEYPRGQYRSNNKGYENLQNILNSEAYLEPFAMPLQYSNRYYGDRKKRSNNKLNKYDMRLKRESKLTPADMLALVALVEAGERSRKESEPDTYTIPETYFPSSVAAKSYYPNNNGNYNNNNNYEYQNSDDNDISSPWAEPSIVDYYGVPYNVDALPKYEIAREHKYGVNRYPTKRFMVSKKKRSLGSGRFASEPLSAVSLVPEHFAKISKSQKYF